MKQGKGAWFHNSPSEVLSCMLLQNMGLDAWYMLPFKSPFPERGLRQPPSATFLQSPSPEQRLRQPVSLNSAS